MSRRHFSSLLFNSISSSPLFSKNPSQSFVSSLKSYPQNLNLCRQCLFSRFLCTSPPDNLDGLLDPQDFSTPETHSLSAQDFAFLRDSPKLDPDKCSNDAVLISNAIRNSSDSFGDETHKFLRRFRDNLNETLVVQVLSLVKSPELGVKFFIWAGRQIGYSHTASVYNALLELLECGSSSDRVPEHFLREIKGEDREMLRKLLNVLIRKCCRNGLWNVALEELGRLKDFGYRPSQATYNALVQVFLRADRLDTAHLVHGEMLELGFKMDEYTLGCFGHALCKAGRWKEGLALIEKEEFVPNTVLYTKMISGLCEASLFEEAMDFLNRMRCNSCIPNVVTFRILLCGCLKKKQLGRCKRILSMMITEGCYPSPGIFNSLVHAYCRSGDYSYAYKLLKKMVRCGCQPGYVVYNILIGGVCGNEELPTLDLLDMAEKAYGEMLTAGVVLNKVNVSNFVRCLCGHGKFDKAYKVINEMMSKGFVPDTSTYSKVIGFLCNASKVEQAFLLFEEMKKNGVVPDVYTYTILIDSFSKAGLIEQARNWFNEMVGNGCAPNVVTYTALIHAYLKARKVPDANQLFEMMLTQGCIPNAVTYSALIDGHCKAGETEKACLIYERMRGNVEVPDVDMYFKIDDQSLKEPNVHTYGALVDGLCKANKVREAGDLLDAMLVEGCEPNHIVYDALIDGFCKSGKLDEAQKVFAKMSEHGYSPNVYTYSSLIDRLFKDKRLDLVLKVLSKMLENSCSPNVVIYTEMVDGLCKVGKTDEAYKLMLMMEEKGCNPNVVTYTAMIDGLGKAGKIDKCLELFKAMSSKGCAPNFITYKVLINHCCAIGLLDEAHKLLDEMKQTYWPKHLAGYRKVIEGYNREFIASLGLLNEISECDSLPIVHIYRVLVDNFVKAGRLEVALELHEEISSSTPFTSVSKDMYTLLIENLSHANKADKALQLFAEMIRLGGYPELSTFFHLIKGLIKINRWDEALQLSDSICQMDIQWASA
ncbi:pentatricopeptide repeat-containing protein At1g06710, mitochondrial [Rosa rugosa]|uniref:pentatricopeptide repeat-containing protein At1g06710, mitochondrial n=1 Tax=Rosa rugosa TaxID=74645 RepID=UPI002B40B036|nr:pentatricopeptide repeat-containing protein At1g06710, mitochondrial [Rosa rugosa]XP_061993180.1 pentatricopeptide repeat-containing protein At1g06710, mitochondrial [Rosa rugosa]XP_061993182.1 pentatricopeptide repeat-containing protein At1g06710, mitochondrial [Rosa rugosa]XP_061993183.1 pentatricopeptide repeat-containing protein At1g06710, mitochondrial [Rosa rugosa]XP_061993184.1 pentatricopeptide repeat-containing protein At1g06710, mitochondrial [Rosa rugosa]